MKGVGRGVADGKVGQGVPQRGVRPKDFPED